MTDPEILIRIEKLEREVQELRRMLLEHIRHHHGFPPFRPGPDDPNIPPPLR